VILSSPLPRAQQTAEIAGAALDTAVTVEATLAPGFAEDALRKLLLAHEGEPRVAELTFDIHHSDLPLRAAFPILVDNLLSYLLPGGFENQSFALGQPVTLAAETGATEVDVTTPDGRVARLRPPLSPFTDTETPGVYGVRQLVPGGARLSRFVVQFADPALSRVAPGAAAIPFEEDRSQQAPAPRGTLELWPWLVGGVLVLVVAEWLVYLRGR
jgi:hypothetical protein